MSVGPVDGGEEDLVVLVGIGEQLVVVELDQEGDLVGVLAGDDAQHAERRGHRVAAALDRQPDDVLGVEIGRVLGERAAGGVLDALVDGQDREVARAAQAPVTVDPLEVGHHAGIAVAGKEDPIDEIRSGQVQDRGGDGLAAVLEQRRPILAQQRENVFSHEIWP